MDTEFLTCVDNAALCSPHTSSLVFEKLTIILHHFPTRIPTSKPTIQTQRGPIAASTLSQSSHLPSLNTRRLIPFPPTSRHRFPCACQQNGHRHAPPVNHINIASIFQGSPFGASTKQLNQHISTHCPRKFKSFTAAVACPLWAGQEPAGIA